MATKYEHVTVRVFFIVIVVCVKYSRMTGSWLWNITRRSFLSSSFLLLPNIVINIENKQLICPDSIGKTAEYHYVFIEANRGVILPAMRIMPIIFSTWL